MSKVRGPLHSVGAHGTIGKAMIHQTWKGVPRVKKYRKPTQPNSAAQLDKRNFIRTGVERWQSLSDLIKGYWMIAIGNVGKAMSGYNFFLSQYIKDITAGITPSDYPPIHLTPDIPVWNGLLAWFRQEENQGNKTYDQINNLSATLTGTSWGDGRIGKAVHYAGTDDQMAIDNPSSFDFGDNDTWTFESWMYWPGQDPKPYVIYVGQQTGQRFFILRYNSTNRIGFRDANNVYFLFPLGSSDQLKNTWTHMVWTHDGQGNFSLYLNSILYGTLTPGWPRVKFQYFGRGYVNPGQSFEGIMDEIRFYNKALSPAEIQHNFNL